MVAIRDALRAVLLPTLLVTFVAGSSRGFALTPDPAVVKEVDAQEQFRKDLRREVLGQKGIDPVRWGEDVANPFTNLTDECKTRLKALGVNGERLAKLPAVLLVGNYCGARSKRFVNHNPDALIILGKGFITHDYVYSMGPILAVEDAHIMGGVVGADLVWFVEKAWPRFATKGATFLAGPQTPQSHESRPPQVPLKGDHGWRRPDDFLKPREVQPGTKLPPLAVHNAEQKRRALFDQIIGRRGTNTADWCERVVNPFSSLSAGGKAKLQARGLDPARLARLKAVLLTGSYCGASSRDFINQDPETVLIIGKDFTTHGSVFSVGPVLAAENAHFMGGLVGADVVWCVDESFPRGITTGLPVILAPSAHHSQMSPGSEDVWYGDYGWRRPTNFLKPAPVNLTGQELEILWAALPENDPQKSVRIVRRLIAGAEQSVPYLKQRLRPEAAPTPEEVARLLADLDSDRFQKREAATVRLEKVGLHVAPALEKLLQNPPSLEARRRAKQVLQLTQEERQRAKLALSALEQIGSPEALALLEEWAKGDANFFLTREAQAALQRLRGLDKP